MSQKSFDNLGFGLYYKQLMKLFRKDGPILDRSDIAMMVNTILRRKRFLISNFEIFTKKCFLCCCRSRNRCVKDKTLQRYRLLEKADKMLNR